MTSVWAHRGSRLRAPENTIEAFSLAVDEGAHGVELDVHFSADGELVVRHDPAVVVDGIEVPIAALTSAQLATLCGAPTLGQVFDLLAPTGLDINVEAKTSDAPYLGIVPALVATWRQSGLGDRVVFSSFNHHTLIELRTAAPHVRCAPLISDGLVAPWDYARAHGFDAVHIYAPILGLPGMIEGFTASGVGMRAWTVNDVETAAALARAGVETIITDDAPAVAAVI